MKTETIQIRISEHEKEKLNELSAKLDIPISQIVRDGVRKQMATLEKSDDRELRPVAAT